MSEDEDRSAATPPTVAFEVAASRARSLGSSENHGAVGAIAAQLAVLDIPTVSSALGGVVEQMASAFRPRQGGPVECEVEFAVKVTAEGGLIISKLAGDVSLRVKVKWDRN